MSLSRRHLFRAIPALLAGKAASAAAAPVVLEFAIAGGAYHGLDTALPTLARGDALLLRREPDNRHDRFAIAVQRRDGLKLGYVPRRANQTLARLMDSGWQPTATIADTAERSPIGAIAFTSLRPGDPVVRVTARLPA